MTKSDFSRVTATAFLRVNGYRPEFDDAEAFSFLIGLYETGNLRSPDPGLPQAADKAVTVTATRLLPSTNG